MKRMISWAAVIGLVALVIYTFSLPFKQMGDTGQGDTGQSELNSFENSVKDLNPIFQTKPEIKDYPPVSTIFDSFEEESSDQSVDDHQDMEEQHILAARWEESAEWKQAGRALLKPETDENTPTVLFRGSTVMKELIYMHGKEIIYQYMDGADWSSVIVHQVAEEWEGLHIWAQQKSILIGGSYAGDERKWGGWVHIWQPNEKAAKPVVKILGRNHILPENVLSISFSEQPVFYLIRVNNEDGSFRDYVYHPQNKDAYWHNSDKVLIDTTIKADQRVKNYFHAGLPEFDPEMKLLTPKEQLHYENDESSIKINHFEYNGGSLLVVNNGSYVRNLHYVENQAIRFKAFSDPEGRLQLLVLFSTPTEKEVIAFATGIEDDFMQYQPLLWAEDWKMVNRGLFYQQHEDALRMITFDHHWEHAVQPARLRSFSWSADQAAIEQNNSLPETVLSYISQEQTYLFSLLDAAYTVLRKDQQSLELDMKEYAVLLQEELLTPIEEADLSDPPAFMSNLEEITVSLPKQLLQKEIKAIPADLQKALDQECFIGCGDSSSEVIHREFEDEWYVINQDAFYKLKEEKLELIGTLPISTDFRFIFEKYAETVTAKDFMKMKDKWVIADTYGHRIIILDDQLKLLHEYPLSYPYRLYEEEGELYVESIQGKSRFSADLKLLEAQRIELQPLEEIVEKEISIRSSTIYKDEETGLTWYYDRRLLHVYDPVEEVYRSTFAGHPTNLSFIPSIIPYGNQRLLLFDDKLLIFNQQGDYLDRIDFLREGFSGWNMGESTYITDRENGLIYMIQGYSIIAIDLINKSTQEIFRQNHSHLGPLVYDDQQLWLTLDYSPIQKSEPDTPNQLVSLHVKTKEIQRRHIPEGYITWGLTVGPENSGIILENRFDQASTDKAKYAVMNVR